jgi:hypothetical protein
MFINLSITKSPYPPISIPSPQTPGTRKPYLSTGNNQLNLSPRGAHELGKLGTDTRKQVEAVVLGEGGQEVLDRVDRGARALVQLGDDGALVGRREGRGLQDRDQLGVLLQQVAEGDDVLTAAVY